MREDLTAKHLQVNGIVQGVGFRPYVHRLAVGLGLTGTVANTGAGVSIHVEGSHQAVAAFSTAVEKGGPPLAHISDMVAENTPLSGYSGFKIVPSRHLENVSTLISPDVGVCDDCLKELFDPHDRRFRYPFINCTHCGPRYTIIDALPYDRPFTAMKKFAMCGPCRAEYDDPASRRFHAQPNACPACGPSVALYGRHRKRLSLEDPIKKAAALLTAGNIIAIKGIGGFHLAANAEHDTAVKALRTRKRRPHKPFAVMAPTVAAAATFARISPEEMALLSTVERPIVLLEKADPCQLSIWVSPENHLVGVMLPYAPLHHLLLADCGLTALVMTSGNFSNRPLCIDNNDAFDQLSAIADYFLVHDREICHRCDDAVVRYVRGAIRQIRRSRGYAPAPIGFKEKTPSVLAVGAQLKNTFCLTRGTSAFISPHMGDLDDVATYQSFGETIDQMRQLLDITPKAVAHDMHPDYLSTRYALSHPSPQKIPVQHHHAHVVSCMAEHGLDGAVIGLALDGTGYGLDGAIWGGEVLVADRANFTRGAQLSYVPLPGGEAAIREPWRTGVSYLYQNFGRAFLELDLPFLQQVDAAACRLTVQMIDRGLNSPLTSSLGRLFDGVAAITNICRTVSFEGQAAMALETLANGGAGEKARPYPYHVMDREGCWQVDVGPLVKQIVSDVMAERSIQKISRDFHASLVDLFTTLCKKVRKETNICKVVLSGGVFQNAILLTGLSHALENEGFAVFSHQQVPTNDGGIALGQAAVAVAQLKKEGAAH